MTKPAKHHSAAPPLRSLVRVAMSLAALLLLGMIATGECVIAAEGSYNNELEPAMRILDFLNDTRCLGILAVYLYCNLKEGPTPSDRTSEGTHGL